MGGRAEEYCVAVMLLFGGVNVGSFCCVCVWCFQSEVFVTPIQQQSMILLWSSMSTSNKDVVY
jgi:hypothetical protein